MIFKKIKSEGLAHNSYLIGNAGEACVIDPRRDVDVYFALAEKHNLDIKYVFETHKNEDYIIGSLEIKDKTDVKILHGANLDFKYGEKVAEGDQFKIGNFLLEILETPGHTEESISIVLKDSKNKDVPVMVFTGDVLFSGDVGRIDFYGEDRKPEMAEKLYNSIFKKIVPLGEHVIVCPAHGQGSVCGAEIGDVEYTTVGYELITNPVIKKDKKSFIEYKTNEKPYVPPYFSKMEDFNKNGPPVFHDLPKVKPLDIPQIKQIKNDVQIVDVRSPVSFANEHMPGSLNIWRNGIPMFAGWFLDYEHPVVLIDDFNVELDNVVRYLFRLGYDKINGFLKDGFSVWSRSNEETMSIGRWHSDKLKENLESDDVFILDVRDIDSRKKHGYIPNSKHVFVGNISDNLDMIPKDKQIVVYCDSGFKTSVVSSYLEKNGYKHLNNLSGGFIAWRKNQHPVEK